MNSYADCTHTKMIGGTPCIHDAHAQGYASALRDAVEAVESQHSDDPMWAGTNWNNALFSAKEAIEALGGER